MGRRDRAHTAAAAKHAVCPGETAHGGWRVTAASRAGPNPRVDEIWDVKINGATFVTIGAADAPKVNTGRKVPRCVKWPRFIPNSNPPMANTESIVCDDGAYCYRVHDLRARTTGTWLYFIDVKTRGGRLRAVTGTRPGWWGMTFEGRRRVAALPLDPSPAWPAPSFHLRGSGS